MTIDPTRLSQGEWLTLGHALVMEAPLLLDRPYVLREWLADKGRGARTVFLNWQFEVTDPDGRLIATGRHCRSWFAAHPTEDHVVAARRGTV